MRKITFDIETTNTFDEVGSSDPADLTIAVVCTHDSETDMYDSFTMDQLPKLWTLLENADMLIGYNSDHFDLPLLGRHYPGDLKKFKSLDLMKEIRAILGRRIKLDDIAQGTLGKGKSADGLQAIVWWRQGDYQKVIDYCIEDVKVTKEIYEFARKNSCVKYYSGEKLLDIPLDTSGWESLKVSGVTGSLF